MMFSRCQTNNSGTNKKSERPLTRRPLFLFRLISTLMWLALSFIKQSLLPLFSWSPIACCAKSGARDVVVCGNSSAEYLHVPVPADPSGGINITQRLH